MTVILKKPTYNLYKNELASQTLVLVHGYVSDSSIWFELMIELKKKYSILILDLPGYVQQEAYNQYFSISDMADFIAAILKDASISHFHYVGHSMGGYIGLEFLSKYGDMLASFTLLNSHCYTDSDERTTNRSKTIDFLKRRGSELYINEIYKTLFEQKFLENNSSLIEKMKNNAKKYPVQTLIFNCQAMIDRLDHSKTLAKATIPVHILLGDKDFLIPMTSFEKMKDLNPIIHLEILKDCGHMGMLEAKSQVISFLASNIK